jgi:hypothetical protein
MMKNERPGLINFFIIPHKRDYLFFTEKNKHGCCYSKDHLYPDYFSIRILAVRYKFSLTRFYNEKKNS